jgi:proline iminopeptidase
MCYPLPPTIAIQGANDAICPPDTALDLHEVWDELELRIVMNGGHSMYDPVVAGEIVKALDRFGHYLKEAFD